MRGSSINYVSSLCSTVVHFAGLLSWKKRFNQILRRGVPFPSHVCPHKFLLYLPQCDGVNNSEAQAGRPFELPSWNTGQGNRGSVLGAVFSFPLCGAFDDC